MNNKKTIGTKVKISDYEKVIDYIDLYNSKTGNQKSISQFVWDSIKFHITYLRNNKGIK